MAEDAIGKAGLYFDELNKIRVLEPEVAVQTNDLKDASKDFIESELNLDVTTTEIDVMKSLPPANSADCYVCPQSFCRTSLQNNVPLRSHGSVVDD